ncbi:hypothetical protein ACIQBJ_30810 [Kitasatospora sp. NPDC088391]|uniref:hypothetical protein n=1 Tax=Kitasatospora sp. NPDC088391 TaxID=3364074 RepID=UPI0038163A6D
MCPAAFTLHTTDVGTSPGSSAPNTFEHAAACSAFVTPSAEAAPADPPTAATTTTNPSTARFHRTTRTALRTHSTTTDSAISYPTHPTPHQHLPPSVGVSHPSRHANGPPRALHP